MRVPTLLAVVAPLAIRSEHSIPMDVGFGSLADFGPRPSDDRFAPASRHHRPPN